MRRFTRSKFKWCDAFDYYQRPDFNFGFSKIIFLRREPRYIKIMHARFRAIKNTEFHEEFIQVYALWDLLGPKSRVSKDSRGKICFAKKWKGFAWLRSRGRLSRRSSPIRPICVIHVCATQSRLFFSLYWCWYSIDDASGKMILENTLSGIATIN